MLTDMSLDFSDDINVIVGRNEAGKSTVAAFIKYTTPALQVRVLVFAPMSCRSFPQASRACISTCSANRAPNICVWLWRLLKNISGTSCHKLNGSIWAVAT